MEGGDPAGGAGASHAAFGQELAVLDDAQAAGPLGHEDRARIGKRHPEGMYQALRHHGDLDPLPGRRVEGERPLAARSLGGTLPLGDGMRLDEQQRCQEGNAREQKARDHRCPM